MSHTLSAEMQTLNAAFIDHYDALVGWCRKRVDRRLGEPEELVHAAWLRCRHGWRAKGRSPRSEMAYLFQSLRWTAADLARNRTRRQGHESAAADAAPASGRDPFWPLRQLAARDALARLPRMQRAICSAILDGKPHHQIRQELSLSPGALAVHLSRARKTLTAALEDGS